MTKEKLIKTIENWLKDYELATDMTYGDEDTLDGSAYIILQKILKHLNNNK